MSKLSPVVFTGIAWAFAAACNPPVEAVWYGDVQTLVQTKCLSCHTADAVGTVSLESYEEAAAVADRMAARVNEGSMPPWLAAQGCNEYRDDGGLTEDQRARFDGWARRGAPEGDPAEATEPPATPDPLANPDLDIAIAPYTPNDQGRSDDYRCFELEHGFTEATWITGIDTIPGVRRMVHHAVYYVVPAEDIGALESRDSAPGWTCFGGPETSIRAILGGWVPGQPPQLYPEGTGIRIEPDDAIVVQLHYNFEAGPAEPDATRTLIKTAADVTTVGEFLPVFQVNFSIPPDTPVYDHSVTDDELANDPDALIHGLLPHMHTLGSRIEVSLDDDPGERCLLDVPRWDFNWQQMFWLAEPVPVQGAEVRLTCTWSNTDGEWVGPGQGTDDEMCVAFLYVTR